MGEELTNSFSNGERREKSSAISVIQMRKAISNYPRDSAERECKCVQPSAAGLSVCLDSHLCTHTSGICHFVDIGKETDTVLLVSHWLSPVSLIIHLSGESHRN